MVGSREATEQGYGALLLRLLLGILFIAHLYWKIAILDGGLSTWWTWSARVTPHLCRHMFFPQRFWAPYFSFQAWRHGTSPLMPFR